MKNKYNIQLIVPSLYKTFDLLIPVNKTIGETIYVLIKSLKELTNIDTLPNNLNLYNQYNGNVYQLNEFIYKTDIKNGSVLILC